jgi:hypothetical protein
MKRKMMNQRGFFLLETVFVGLILLAVSAFLGACRVGSQAQETSAMRVTAAFLAQKQLAFIQGDKTLRIKNGDISWLGLGEESKITKNGTIFEVRTRLSKVSDTSELKQIEVKVQWQERKKENEIKIIRLVRCDGE